MMHTNWLIVRDFSKKAMGIHNIDAVIKLTTRMEVIMTKLDNLSQSVNMVNQPALVCAGSRVDHISASCPLASTYTIQPTEVSYAQNFKRQEYNSYPKNYFPSLNNYPN